MLSDEELEAIRYRRREGLSVAARQHGDAARLLDEVDRVRAIVAGAEDARPGDLVALRRVAAAADHLASRRTDAGVLAELPALREALAELDAVPPAGGVSGPAGPDPVVTEAGRHPAGG